MPRYSFKADASFFEKITIGAIGARAVAADLDRRGHEIFELENGATTTKLWKDVKRKRVRIPDLVCRRCGMRVESRAKTGSAKLSMSHSTTDAERAWDYGLVDSDVVAFPVCASEQADEWALGRLDDGISYWHERRRTGWRVQPYINYLRVEELRRTPPSRSDMKGATEGSETTITWSAIFSNRSGVIEAIDGARVTIRRDIDGRRYTWSNRTNLPVRVRVDDHVEDGQLIAATVAPLQEDDLRCPGVLAADRIIELIASPERTQRFTGIKLARLRGEASIANAVAELVEHPDEDVYVRLEGAVYLARTVEGSTEQLFRPFLNSIDAQIQLEAVIALAETANAAATRLAAEILGDPRTPYFLRSAAAWALGQIGTDEAAGHLVNAFSDVDISVREEALVALDDIGHPALPVLLRTVIADEGDRAAGAAEALRRMAPLTPDAVAQLVQAVRRRQDSPWTVWLLGNLAGLDTAVEQAIAEIQDSRPEAHFAMAVLWSFVRSWVARRWEVHPHGRVRRE
ncbi:MAG: HEAT repeat domain-containing protein [Gammaproteobacteria bacterium]